uniref:Transmembrane emp24 domain-containing protein n=1 Tax=Aceria tosichella TaxID=561515 RepID=A0A6G1SCB1_9ACAR
MRYIPSPVILLAVFATFTLVQVTHCHLITIDPHQEECFHETLKKGTKIKFTFEVLDGGSLDIDLTIKDPNNYVIHSEQRQSSGRYTIEANQEGPHAYCFANKMSSLAMKIVMFNIEFTDRKNESDQEQDKLQNMVTELSALVTGVKHEMDFLAARDRIHRRISERINSRVSMWSMFEVLLTLIVAVGQTYYLKRFFEVRRKV